MSFTCDYAFNAKHDTKYDSFPFLLGLNVLGKKIFLLTSTDSIIISKAILMSLLSGICDRRQTKLKAL